MGVIDLVVVLSGPVSSGKSSLAKGLCSRFGGVRFSTRELLLSHLGGTEQSLDRATLQDVGDRLDVETNGAWVRDAVSRDIYEIDGVRFAVIDSVRKLSQVEAFRESFDRRVVHVHLAASETTLGQRYAERAKDGVIEEFTSYEAVRDNETEKHIGDLAAHADNVINTERASAEDVLVLAARKLGLLAGEAAPLVDVIVGGAYGSEGKGHIAFYLAPEYDLLVRVGGPNAGHKVRLPTDKVYTHRSLPSGTLAGNAELLIGPGAILNIDVLMNEISKTGIGADRLRIDPRALIIEPEDIEAEEKIRKSIGSTAQGVGRALIRKISREGDVRCARQVKDLRPFIKDSMEVLEEAFRLGRRVMLEGTQGTGLSLHHGSYPHVTSRDTTVAGCLSEAGIAPGRVRKVVMVCRTFPIRVEDPPAKGQTSGPMTKEIPWGELERRAGFRSGELSDHEKGSVSKKQRRVGEFEWTSLRKAAALNAPTDIAITFADYISKKNEDARRFEQLTDRTIRFIEEVESVAAAPVTLISTRFHRHRSIIDRRSW